MKTKTLIGMVVMLMALAGITANAAAPERKMLEEGKTWVYVYHDVEGVDDPSSYHPMWSVYYQLNGDTIINGRQYMRMYREDENESGRQYYGAFREDEEGRVYMYDYNGDEKDFMIFDLSLHFDDNHFPDATPVAETIKEHGKLFCRYRYQNTRPDGSLYNLSYIAVEGVGFQGKGLVHYLFEPEFDPYHNYEELEGVMANNFYFSAAGFQAPKEIELTDNEKNLIASNNDFAFNLFRMARGEESRVLSPLSITYALGLMNNGAAGQTQQEINKTLGFGEAGADAINAFCQKMLRESETLDEKTKSLIANTIFVNEGMGYRLQDEFIKKANDYYNAQPQNRDFNDGETMDVINQWANDHTMGMIPQVLDENSFNPFAVNYLLNAIYFKGAWSHPFNKAETKEERFGGGETVPMMHKSYTEFDYTENDLYQGVNLPYGNGAYRMSIFLPREGKTVGDVLNDLYGSNWQIKGYRCEVDVKLPRFETDTYMGLVEIMSALGMPTAFGSYAEFPFFCNSSLFIGDMFQVAKIKLDEEGTEAAAVTVLSGATSMPRRAEFHATRPFLYIISEQSTGAIFFIGQYMGKTPAGVAAPHIQKSAVDGAIYNLAGQRLSTPPTHGIYIRDGKKVMK